MHAGLASTGTRSLIDLWSWFFTRAPATSAPGLGRDASAPSSPTRVPSLLPSAAVGVADPGDNNSDSQRDRVLHGIGRVAQAHVGLDLKLRQLYTALGVPFALAGALTETELVPSGWNFKKLVAECRSRLRDGPWDSGLKHAGEGVMADALNVNELRDRVVHDMWVDGQRKKPRTSRWSGGSCEGLGTRSRPMRAI